jgi:hypothetical protein
VSRAGLGVVEEPVEDGCSVGLVVVTGVVSLAEQDGDELGSGLEVALRDEAWRRGGVRGSDRDP